MALDLAPLQRHEVERLIEVNQRVSAVCERGIELCERIRQGAIERILEKDDLDLGLEVLTGIRDLPQPNPIDDLIAGLEVPIIPTIVQHASAALEIHQFVESVLSAAGADEQIMTHPDILQFMMRFRRIVDGAEPGELDALMERFRGFHRFARMLEELAVAIREMREMRA